MTTREELNEVSRLCAAFLRTTTEEERLNGLFLQLLRWRCVECVIHHERDVCEEQHPYICGTNKQY